ncbi:hypothetical protein K466DRAFT_582848 [Polyporus arcularius HHB13444]|uniref:REJ domain-containing protein n=1 Tax=Polyporus arcularius HHB13444 TaxID=1314778 RepID=A0A5C3PNW2_9APHY|nr:hypothetical protein K466DRAFT_582848 [Polyporus arcularius HHB13444]
MLHNQSILGFSLLVLSCASPSLGDAVSAAPSSVDPMSPPSSPTLGTNPGHAFQDINPPRVLSSSPSAAGLPTMVMSNPTSVAGTAAFNPAITPSPLAAEVSPASTATLLNVSSHRSSKQRAKVHSSIAAHFSSQLQLQLQAQTLAQTSHTEPTASPQIQLDQSSAITSSSASAPSFSSSDLQVSTSASSMESSATLAISSHPFSAPAFSATASRAVPTSHDLDEPNPDVHSQSSEASLRARKTAVLAALLILGTLGALGGGILCFRCGVFPCCHNVRRRRGPTSAERTAEEGFRGVAKLAPGALSEKSGSLAPGKPSVATGSVVHPVFPRNLHAHTLSCSTCPPDSLNGVRGGVSGTGMGSAADIHVYSTNEESAFEDVTHILSSGVFSDKAMSSEGSSTSTDLRSPRDSGTSRATRASSASGSDAARLSTATTVSASASVHTRMSRASGGAASLTAESYTTCESRYSTPSIDHGPAAIAEDSEEDEYYSPASPQSSASSASTASGGSVSVLLMTPEQNDYAGLADAALPRVRVAGPGPERAASPAGSGSGSDMDIDGDGDCDGSDWDVAHAYGAPPAIPLPPTPAPRPDARMAKGMYAGRKPVKGRPQTGVGLAVGKGRGGAVALGGRKVMFMHG